jgi:hypothetical protein
MSPSTPPAWRNDDGGFGPVAGSPSEPESTAMVALAFDDDVARAWLADAQLGDGSIGVRAGLVVRDVTALGALAFRDGVPREKALDHLVTVAGENGPDPTVTTAGWPWTEGAHGWTEPTAWGLMAVRLRPDATDRFADALAFFRERECTGGGWNYGAPETLSVPIGPYVQTTALAVLALAHDEPELAARGVRTLERTWRSEAEGVLTLATTVCALRFAGSREASAAQASLGARARDADDDTVATAWLAFASGAPGPWEERG